MRIPSLLFAIALLGTSAWANDEESRYYIQFGLGGVFTSTAEGVPGGSIDFDPGFSTGLAFGRNWALSERLGFDVEAEAFYQYFTVDEEDILAIPSAVDDDAKVFALMLNGIVDWRFTPQYSIYGGVGVGYAKEIQYSAWDSGNLSISDSSAVAFQGRFGFGYNLGGNYDVRLGYRFFKTETLDIEDLITGQVDELDVEQHSVEATFRWGL